MAMKIILPQCGPTAGTLQEVFQAFCPSPWLQHWFLFFWSIYLLKLSSLEVLWFSRMHTAMEGPSNSQSYKSIDFSLLYNYRCLHTAHIYKLIYKLRDLLFFSFSHTWLTQGNFTGNVKPKMSQIWEERSQVELLCHKVSEIFEPFSWRWKLDGTICLELVEVESVEN